MVQLGPPERQVPCELGGRVHSLPLTWHLPGGSLRLPGASPQVPCEWEEGYFHPALARHPTPSCQDQCRLPTALPRQSLGRRISQRAVHAFRNANCSSHQTHQPGIGLLVDANSILQVDHSSSTKPWYITVRWRLFLFPDLQYLGHRIWPWP